ncbi:MAG: hypothetical protein ACD_7C00492G0012 [uncultured bacterium]|nr:MAG: hypothetical protein ACD_7C00492G0012 [uncultured bacterium]HBR79344.1 hypothetical protein [Candidatus Moranbacteria bacterium]
MLFKQTEKIVIVDCCGIRFSKVNCWNKDSVVCERACIELYPGQAWYVYVENILPKLSSANPYELDVVFTTSEDENLFYCLCDCLGDKGWFENEDACIGLPHR